jgi:hypothetical protein
MSGNEQPSNFEAVPTGESATPKEALDPRIAEMLKPEQTAVLVVDMMDGYAKPDAPLLKFLKSIGAPHTTQDLDEAADRMAEFMDASRDHKT